MDNGTDPARQAETDLVDYFDEEAEIEQIRAMSDADLLANLNGFDLYDDEFRRRYTALSAESDALASQLAEAQDCRKWWFFPIQMALTPEGKGPAFPGRDEIGSITYEVWDRELNTHASFDNLPDAIIDAMQRNAALAKTEGRE
jgi:hypothetical protein